MKKYHNNNKKWIRVRQTGSYTTIAIKHIKIGNAKLTPKYDLNGIEIEFVRGVNISASNIKEIQDLVNNDPEMEPEKFIELNIH